MAEAFLLDTTSCWAAGPKVQLVRFMNPPNF